MFHVGTESTTRSPETSVIVNALIVSPYKVPRRYILVHSQESFLRMNMYDSSIVLTSQRPYAADLSHETGFSSGGFREPIR